MRIPAILITILWSNMVLGQYVEQKPSEFIWNLSTLYSSGQEWDSDKGYILENVKKIEYKAQQINTSDELVELMKFVSGLRARAAKMVVYGALTSNLDYKDEVAEERYKIAVQLEDMVERSAVRMDQLIASLPEKEVKKWIKTNPALKEHAKRINRILVNQPYLLDKDGEQLMRSLGRVRQLPGEIYTSFMDAPTGWPEILLSDGSSAILTPSKFHQLRNTDNEEDRKLVLRTYHEHLGANGALLGTLLSSRIETDLKLAEIRGFSSGMDAEFYLRDGFKIGSHLALLQAAQSNKSTLQRFVRVRAKLIDKEVIDYADLFGNPFSSDESFTLGRSLEIIEGATSFLGKEYQNNLFSVLKDSTMHLALTPNKRRMWAIYPPVGGAKPYIILSYDDSFLASNVLSRALVGNLAQHHYQPDTRDDPPVYNNGVIYVGSLLHYDYMIEKGKEKDTKLYYLVEETNRLWKTFFRYMIITELEKFIEDALKGNRVPNGEEISDKYYQLIRSYYGDEAINIQDFYKYEWLTIAQPFHTIEHQYWPPAMATACAILSKVEKGDDDIVDLLVGKVTSESDRSYQILKEAGIDLMDKESYQHLFNRFNLLLNLIEDTLDGD